MYSLTSCLLVAWNPLQTSAISLVVVVYMEYADLFATQSLFSRSETLKSVAQAVHLLKWKLCLLKYVCRSKAAERERLPSFTMAGKLNWRMFADKSSFFLQTTDNCSNLLKQSHGGFFWCCTFFATDLTQLHAKTFSMYSKLVNVYFNLVGWSHSLGLCYWGLNKIVSMSFS